MRFFDNYINVKILITWLTTTLGDNTQYDKEEVFSNWN